MPLPHRAVATNPTHNRENLTRAAKNNVVAAVRPIQRPALGDIKLPNRTVQNPSAALKKPVVSYHVPNKNIGTNKSVPISSKPIKSETVTKPDLPTLQEDVTCPANQIEVISDVDADVDDQKNPFLVAEYAQDIFKYLCQIERKYKIQDNYLIGHQTTARMRTVLINWMVDVCINFKFLQETLHLTVNVIDRYLQVNKTVGRETLQLVGIASLVIASKYEEIYVPSIDDFEYICDHSFTAKQIYKREIDILNKLKFSLGKPLSLHFLRRFSKIAGSDIDQHNMAKYFLEIFLLDYDICSTDPSLQAAAACCLSLCVLNDLSNPANAWSKTLEYYSTYKYSDLKPVIVKLVVALRKMEKSKFQAVRKKYADAKLGCISNHFKLDVSKALTDIYEKATVVLKH